MTNQSQAASLRIFLTIISVSSLNFLAFWFLIFYQGIGRVLFRELSSVWIALPVVVSLLAVPALSSFDRPESLHKACSSLIKILKVLSYTTFTGAIFFLARYIVSHWNEKGLAYSLFTTNETALIGLVMSVLFLRLGWELREEPAHDSIIERFEFFLFRWEREYGLGTPSPKGPSPRVLLLLGVLNFFPPIVHYLSIGQKEATAVGADDANYYNKRLLEIISLETAHWRKDESLSSADVSALKKALEDYKDLEKELKSAKYPPSYGPKSSNCLLGQIRIYIRLGQYDKAMPLLARHRQEDKQSWDVLGKLSDSSAKMLPVHFALAYFRVENFEKAIQIRKATLRRKDSPILSGDFLLAVSLAANGQWDEALDECSLEPSYSQILKKPDWDSLKRKIENRDSDVGSLLESAYYRS